MLSIENDNLSISLACLLEIHHKNVLIKSKKKFIIRTIKRLNDLIFTKLIKK